MTPEDWLRAARDRPEWECWGKAQPDGEHPAHPLLCHLLDVAAVASYLLTTHTPRALRRPLLDLVQGNEEASLSLLLYVIALHDIGKFTPAFQVKVEWASRLLPLCGFDIDPPQGARPHGAAGLGFLRDALRSEGVSPVEALALARAVVAHHGEFPTDRLFNAQPMGPQERGRLGRWNDARSRTFESLRGLFGLPLLETVRLDHAFVIRLAGLTAVADWIGSMEQVFAYEPPQESLQAYWALALDRAADALERVGMRPYLSEVSRSFSDLFPTLRPWPLHLAVESLSANPSCPALVIVEAPMGEGKTEAALMLANGAAAHVGQQGTYFGLPTKATANQMLGRVRAFLERTRPDTRSSLVLAHGDAQSVESFRSLVGIHDEGESSGGVRAEEWFLSKKRTLLAEHAVGTIDQALLGVLRTRHGFVRLYGLAGKTVVLDEVHAYDTFTSTILDRLVEWLAALGTTVVLLSATLPRARRVALMAAYRTGAGGVAGTASEEVEYPRLTSVTRDTESALHFAPRGEPVAVEITRIDPDLEKIARSLLYQLRNGGCAGWICNTVNRAQAAYEAISHLDPELPRLLLHARMLPDDRDRREQQLQEFLGPEGAGTNRPTRCLIVGTQVLEQSLDVDFDLLVTDLAPVDLLLQRAGRLHRHRDRSNRSPAHPSPRLYVAYPQGPSTSVSIGSVAKVYAEVIVRSTLRTLEGRNSVTLPDDIEALVEDVYRGSLPEASDALFGAYLDFFGGVIAQRQNASIRLLPRPRNEDDIFGSLRMPFTDDEDPQVHEELLAITRDGERSVQFVCLAERDGRIFLSDTDGDPLLLNVAPDRSLAARLARRTISVTHRKLVPALLALPVPAGWQERAMLRHRRAVVFTKGVAHVGGIRLELHPELGLILDLSGSDE